MTLELLDVSSSPASSLPADVVVVGATSSPDGPALFADEAFSSLGPVLAGVGQNGSADRLVRLPATTGEAPVVAVIGIGPEVTPAALRSAAGSAVRQLAGVHRIVFALPLEDAALLTAVLEGAALGAYAYTAEKGLSPVTAPVAEVVVATTLSPAPGEIERSLVTAEGVHLVRDLGNTSASELHPEALARAAADAVDGLPVEVEVWDEEALERDGFGGILGVGRGSARPPRLVKLSYAPAEATAHLALVGKGITFDTGGLSLKPASGMIGMKYDMLGAATVLATVVAAARLALPVRLTAWLCVAENMPSGRATRPGDVLRMYGGRTVEVVNTDAEGRLVMADGLVAASEEHPDAVIDVATLTGAALVALGNRYTGVMGDPDLAARVVECADAVGEPSWRMPLPEELRSVLDSDVADIANANLSHREGGMLVAAHFLSEFVGRTGGDDSPRIPWAHLDIAGPGDNGSAAYGFTPKGATGTGVRTLLAVASDLMSR